MAKNNMLLLFVVFLSGAIFSLILNHKFVVEEQSKKNNQMIVALFSEISNSEIIGALSIIDQCNDKGIAFVRTLDGNEGYMMSCNPEGITTISDDRVSQLSIEAKQYASKRFYSRMR